MMKNKITLAIASILFTASAFGQVLTLTDAIAQGLKKNHNIIMANQLNEATQTKIHIGQVGFLPKVDVVAQKSTTGSVTDMEFSTPAIPAIVDQEAGSSADLAQLQLSYMLFNGGGRLLSYSKLKKSGNLSEIQKKLSIESSILQIVNAYHEVIRLSEADKINEENLQLSTDRVARSKAQFEFGNGSKIEVLTAKVDFNTDQSEVLTSTLNLRKAKNQLNFLLGNQIDQKVQVQSDLPLPNLDSLQSYQTKAAQNNSNLALSEINLKLSELDRKINKTTLLPTVSGSINYGYQGSANDVGIVKESSSLGFTAAISLNWNLFDGLKRRKALQQSQILIDMSQTKKEQATLKVSLELHNYYESLSTYLSIIDLEQNNLELAQLNVDRSKELLQNGSITSLQFRQAQLNLLRLKSKTNNYLYLANIMHYQLLRMTDQLLVEERI
jgi:outer membrane protein